MSGNSLNLWDESDHPRVEPAPRVVLEIEGTEVTLGVGESYPLASALEVRVLRVERPVERPVTGNGKCYYLIEYPGGTHTEYTRTEERAVELFESKWPNEPILSIRTESN